MGFFLAGCKHDDDCRDDQACLRRECQNPCLFTQCGTNAICKARRHKAECFCLPHHKGNAYHHCEPYECLENPDCITTLACVNLKCVDPCKCAINADCTARNHEGICVCRTGYTGDPYGVACTKSKEFFVVKPKSCSDLCLVSVPPKPTGCQQDFECASQLACFSGKCKNPCREIRPCAPNADCRVQDTLPRRTMSCTCRDGFKGRGDVRCEKISKILKNIAPT